MSVKRLGGVHGISNTITQLVIFPQRGYGWDMSTKSEAILEQFETLPPAEKQALWRELQRRVAPVELYGEPLTDADIAGSARVTFAML